MKAVCIHQFGNEDVLKYEDASDPSYGLSDILIRVKAASINRGDLGRRMGTYPGTPQFPIIIGWDVAGVVEALGSQVSGFSIGDRVVARVPSGGYAEFVTAPSAGTVRLPGNVGFEDASTIPIVFLTSWFALLKLASLQVGETALVQAAASGVGIAGIQIAKLAGAQVITTASTASKLEMAKGLGADYGINYMAQDFVPEVMRLTEGAGVQVVLESVGGEVFTKSISVLGRGGRLVTVGNSARQPAQVDPGLLLRNGVMLRGMSLASQPDILTEFQKIVRLFGEGKLRAVVDKVFSFKEAAAAHRYVAERKNVGKVVLVP